MVRVKDVTDHSVFGRVVSGMEHINVIGKQSTDSKDKPINPVTVTHCGELELRRPPPKQPTRSISRSPSPRRRSRSRSIDDRRRGGRSQSPRRERSYSDSESEEERRRRRKERKERKERKREKRGKRAKEPEEETLEELDARWVYILLILLVLYLFFRQRESHGVHTRHKVTVFGDFGNCLLSSIADATDSSERKTNV